MPVAIRGGTAKAQKKKMLKEWTRLKLFSILGKRKN